MTFEKIDESLLAFKEKMITQLSLDNHLSQNELVRPTKDDSELMQISDYLVGFSTTPKSYCVGCVDMVNSTKISATLPQRQLSTYYEVFLNSMSIVISTFGGKVIKNIGDCLLYYFPESLNSKTEGLKKSLDCGLAMIDSHKTICKQLYAKRLPRLDYRISADYGSVIIMNTSNSSSIDLIGPPINMCTKINRSAEKNEFVVGGDLKQVIQKIDGYRLHQIDGYSLGFRQTYPVFKVERK